MAWASSIPQLERVHYLCQDDMAQSLHMWRWHVLGWEASLTLYACWYFSSLMVKFGVGSKAKRPFKKNHENQIKSLNVNEISACVDIL